MNKKDEIWELYPDFSQRQLAAKFNVSRRLIQFILDPEKQKKGFRK